MNHRLRTRLLILSVLLIAAGIASTLTLAQGTPPTIPHPLKNYRGCLVCHGTGLASAPQVPDSHDGFENEICTSCHLTGEEAAEQSGAAAAGPGPEQIPHPIEGRENCVQCHQPAEGGEIIPAAAGAPAIPHTLEGHDKCLACHQEGVGGAPQMPDDHAGRTEEICQACHQPGGTMTVGGSGEGGAPNIPHTLVGRDDCLGCHEQGFGGAPQIPDDHAGRSNDICQACHQSTEAAPEAAEPIASGPIPTPIPHPPVQDTDSCVACHEALEGAQGQVTADWAMSIHAERDVSCADCHGGDPTASTVNESMDPAAGYIGAPDKADIPALCASCHADVNLMRQYDLPTDQWAKYQESIHGIQLARGDEKVTTCYDCHGGHKILKANDPASTVYASNVPALCAGCHSDQELMRPYGIPTDQYDLYRESVHGIALLDHQDFRAPNCATCHGTHGAAPPGFNEVSNVCGSCHSATQEHYLQSAHANVEGGPECVTCHGRYDVGVPDDSMYLGSEPRHCGSCHPEDSPEGQIVQSIYDNITQADAAYEEAENRVEGVKRLGMLVLDEEGRLQESNTKLITARALQHTTDLATVKEKTDEAASLANEAKQGADSAAAENLFRRQAMVVAVIAIAFAIGALYLLKRELDRRLEREDAQEQ
ncbi:MAG: cytochrome c3 family protein [Caldilineales bacterium]|nr:cytochrome c3 family protein [Caldilineales bacterium]